MSNIVFQDIQNKVEEFLFLADKDYIRLCFAVLIGNQMANQRPIWLMLVAPPSSGKTTALNAFNDLEIINRFSGEKVQPTVNISDITENSFASGMNRGDTQTSLLHKIPRGGLMIFKDFTTMLSKNEQTKLAIMSQLREIYDGAYVKRTGNGNDVLWTGKVGAIAGVTETVYQHMSSMSAMGDRFMMYQIPQPDRVAMLRYKLSQQKRGITEHIVMPELKKMTQEYLQKAFDNMSTVDLELPEEHEEEIIQVADFCTKVRSGLIVDDFRQKVMFVPQAEMPARMFEQMMALGAAFVLMRKIDVPNSEMGLTETDFRIIYKIAFDSIPIVRRMALRYLTMYKNGVDTNALAKKLRYDVDVVADWMQQLNALGIVDRYARQTGGYFWKLKPKHFAIMERLDSIKAMNASMDDNGLDDPETDPDELAEDTWNEMKEKEYEITNVIGNKMPEPVTDPDDGSDW